VPAHRTATIFGVTFTDLSYAESVDKLREMLRSTVPHQVVLANAHTLNLAYTNPAYRTRLQQASLILRDGIGVKLAARAARSPLAHNFVGTDFVPRALRDLASAPLRVYLFGARPGIAEAAGRELEQQCDGLRIVGSHHGHVPKAGWTAVTWDINRLAPDVLLVALGNPLQEEWIAGHLPQLNVRIAIGVGALFDYLAGDVVRAPGWIRGIGGEWAFRLALEPKRLWRRYVVGNPLFVYRLVREILRPVSPSQTPVTVRNK
jgi:exopolysaccharide biosynthesis WecB/TagA/CpsF family protein